MTAKQFIKKHPNTDRNENCLQDIACPKCGYRSQFSISSRCSFVMGGGGSVPWRGSLEVDVQDDHGDIEYDKDSVAQCLQCELIAPLSKFTIEGLDDLLQ